MIALVHFYKSCIELLEIVSCLEGDLLDAVLVSESLENVDAVVLFRIDFFFILFFLLLLLFVVVFFIVDV